MLYAKVVGSHICIHGEMNHKSKLFNTSINIKLACNLMHMYVIHLQISIIKCVLKFYQVYIYNVFIFENIKYLLIK